MSNKALIIADVAFLFVLALIYKTDGLRDYPIVFSPLIVLAFASCVIRHINHYKLTRKT